MVIGIIAVLSTIGCTLQFFMRGDKSKQYLEAQTTERKQT